jgi:hypothetical protein
MSWQEAIVKVAECAMWAGIAFAAAWAGRELFR